MRCGPPAEVSRRRCLNTDDSTRRSSAIAKTVAILMGFLCAFATTFIGLVAVPFTGYGFGLARVANHYLNISLGLELPLYIVLICTRRKAPMYACVAMCLINYLGVFLLTLCDVSGPLHTTTLLRLFAESIFFPGEISSIAVALIAVYLYGNRGECPGSQG